MIYADPSFLASFYGWDDNTLKAQAAYSKDGRRPLCFTQWQRFEVRNALRLAAGQTTRSGRAAPFQPENLIKRMDEDVAAGRLKHFEPDWLEAFRLSEELSDQYSATLGCGAADVWHVASARLLGADTFWTFDVIQHKLAVAAGCFRRAPNLTN